MPCISLRTNQHIADNTEVQLKQAFGQAITILPRKSEQWLMCVMQGDCQLWFAGENTAAAFLEVGLFGAAPQEAYSTLTAALTKIVSEQLQIPIDRIYIKYSETDTWGWNGKNF